MKILRGICVVLLLGANMGQAFSLLGPLTPWMDINKSYYPSDVGGPMNLGEGYRWNVPVITYGFDRAFQDYFGSNGVAAVESAIQLLNAVPPASSIVLSNYPGDIWRVNSQAQALGLMDLKSMAVGLLLEQMGLTSPLRYTYCIREYFPGTDYAFLVVRRNFDPATAQPSSYVNETYLSYQILQALPQPNGITAFCDAQEFPVDPLATFNTTATGFPDGPGYYLTNLSRDDVGGLRYLLNGDRVYFENLLPDVCRAGGDTNIVRAAYRPGIEKIALVRHPAGELSGAFRPFTNRWTDVYYDGDYPAYQPVERVTAQPDILFTARDLSSLGATRTSASNWVNNAALNGNPSGAGPGVITPPIEINLNNAGPIYYNFGPRNLEELNAILLQGWASFDGSTNGVFIYPAGQAVFQPSQVHFNLIVAGRTNKFSWALAGVANSRFDFQTTTNLSAPWTTLAALTNSGATFSYTFEAVTNEDSRFFRTHGQ